MSETKKENRNKSKPEKFNPVAGQDLANKFWANNIKIANKTVKVGK